jgi:hypothetical protein
MNATVADPVLGEFFVRMCETVEYACAEADGGYVRRARVANRVVELRAPNGAFLGRIWPALAHLAVAADREAGEPDLIVYVCDSASTGVPPAPSPWPLTDFDARKRVGAALERPRFRASYSVACELLCLMDSERRIAVAWAQDAAALPEWECAAPLRPIWTWWGGLVGMRMVHGAAVGYPDGGVLITARGGSGKSTTALTCLQSELRYAADDYCGISMGDGAAPMVHSLFNTGKVRSENVHRVEHLSGEDFRLSQEAADVQTTETKRIFHLYPGWSDKLITQFPLRAVLVPRIHGGADTTVESISPALALRALAPSTLFQLGADGAVDLRALGEIVRSAPCFVLHLGSELERIPHALSALLHRLGAGRNVVA